MGWLNKLAEEATFTAASDDDFIPADAIHRRGLPRTDYGYDQAVRGGLDSNVVMSPVNWLTRNFTEAEFSMEEREDGMWSPVVEHPLIERVNRPNPFYGGELLWKATLTSFLLDGNGYWRKIRSRLRRVVQLWYLPHFLVDPKFPRDGSEFISHYEYRPKFGGTTEEIDPDDIVHFRYGLDPNNVRLGLSPIRPILREVFTDEEAANFSASILRNMGVPGGIIAPADGQARPSPEDIQEMKEYMKSGFTGDRRGEWLVLGTPTNTEQFGFDPNQLMLGNLRDIAEERVCAALGIPAAVVGFGAGLQQTKVGAPQPVSARVWTPSGPTTMGDVEPGDVVAVPDGWSAVEDVYPQGEQDIYRVTFQDGSTAESTLDHLWDVHTPNQGWRTEPLSEIASWPEWKLRRAHLPLQGVTEFAERPTRIPPYVMGLLLADGTFRSNLAFSNSSTEIVETMKEKVPAGYDVNRTTEDGHDYRLSYRDHAKGRGIGGGTGDLNPFKDELRRLGLWMLYSHEKFIPDLYKYNSSRVRRALLQGILDGDGYVNLHGQPALEQTSERLADDVTFLVQSLGGYTLKSLKEADRSEREINGRTMRSRHDRYHLSIVVEDAAPLFGCSEKRDRCRRRTKAPTRKFRSIEFVRREEAKCIKVDGSLYLTDNFLVTHNTMRELVRLARVNCVEPTQTSIARQLTRQLVPDFEANLTGVRAAFDNRNVAMFQEDLSDVAKRAALLYREGVISREQALDMINMTPDEGGTFREPSANGRGDGSDLRIDAIYERMEAQANG